jgi:hypothetical protein
VIRRRSQLLEEHTFAAGVVARTLTRSHTGATFTRITYVSTDGQYFHGNVPTQHGFVVFDRWRDQTRFQMIVDGTLYVRVDRETLGRRAITTRAGFFAKRAAVLHAQWIRAGGGE